MPHSAKVERIDELRRQGLTTWEEYGRLIEGQMDQSVGEYIG